MRDVTVDKDGNIVLLCFVQYSVMEPNGITLTKYTPSLDLISKIVYGNEKGLVIADISLMADGSFLISGQIEGPSMFEGDAVLSKF